MCVSFADPYTPLATSQATLACCLATFGVSDIAGCSRPLFIGCCFDKQAEKDKCLILLCHYGRRWRAVRKVEAILTCVFNNHLIRRCFMQKVMVMCLVASAVLAASCATLRELGSGKQVRRAMLVGAGIGVGTGTVAGVATTGGKGALTGALFGAALGAASSVASSYLIHEALASLTPAFRSQDHKLRFHLGSLHLGLQKRDARTRRQTLLNLDKFSVSARNPRSGCAGLQAVRS